ncbi:MAG: hypothetical protein AAGA87_03795 [Pseudomonadota bacterium]
MDKNTRISILIIIGAVLAAVVVIGGIVWGVMALTSETRETGKAFVIDLSSGEFEKARGAMHPSLAQTLTNEELAEMMAGSEAYESVSFSSIESVNSETTLRGTATTVSDCTSRVDLELLDGKITSFNITPLCPEP